MGEVTLEMSGAAYESMRRATLTATAENLRAVADAFELAGSDPTPITRGDADTALGIAREDLDAVAALGYGEAI